MAEAGGGEPGGAGVRPCCPQSGALTLHVLTYAANAGAVALLLVSERDLQQFALALLPAVALASFLCLAATWRELRTKSSSGRLCCLLEAPFLLVVCGVFQLANLWFACRDLAAAGGRAPAAAGPASTGLRGGGRRPRRSSEPAAAAGASCASSCAGGSLGGGGQRQLPRAHSTTAALPLLNPAAPGVGPTLAAPAAAGAAVGGQLARRPPPRAAGACERRCWRYSCRGVDAVFEGALFSGFFFYILATRPSAHLSFRTCCVLWSSSVLSLLSAASCLLEVDRNSSEVLSACLQRNGARAALLHFLLRATEIASRLLVLGLLAVLLGAAHSARVLPALLLADYSATALALLCLGGCECLALLVALPAVLANVVMFVDSPSWVPSARKVTTCLRAVRAVELLLVLGGMALALSGEWPAVVGTESPFEFPGDLGHMDALSWDTLDELLETRCLLPVAAGLLCLVLHFLLALWFRWCLARQAQADGLHRAAERGDVDRLSGLLFARGGGRGRLAGLIDQPNEEGLAPLHVAVQGGQARSVAVLLRARAEVTATAPGGETPVMLAAAAGRDDVLRHLLLHGGAPTVSARSNRGDTALHFAMREGRSACVHSLLRARADPGVRNAEGRKALELAAETRGDVAALLPPSRPLLVAEPSGGAATVPAGPSRTGGTSPAAYEEGLTTTPSCTSQSSQFGFHAPTGSEFLAINSAADSDLDAMLAEAPVASMQRSAFTGSNAGTWSSQGLSFMVRSAGSSGSYRRAFSAFLRAEPLASAGRPLPVVVEPEGLASLVALAAPGALRRLALPSQDESALAMAEARRASRSRRPPPGASLLDCFQIVRLVGEGNFGTVYEARDVREREGRGEACERRCALKILHRQKYRVESMMVRARYERQVLKAAHHPCIVRLLCAFKTPANELALVMEYCPNGDLNELVVRRGTPGLEESLARRLLAEVLLGLQYLHEELDVVFRDLKPENVVLDVGMHAKLTDFGLVKVNVSEGDGAHSFVGSTYYVAPEVSAYGCEPYGQAVDLYALGLVSWVCLTGGVRVSTGPEDAAERAEPPPSHEAMEEWLRAAQAAASCPASAPQAPPRGLPPVEGLSESALAWITRLTSREAKARGTAGSLRLHPFFAQPGLEPPLACRDDWVALLPPIEEPATPTSTGSTDSWVWDPSWRL